MKILITGATGMVGKNLLEQSDIAKHQLLTPGREQLQLALYEHTEKYLRQHQPDMIIHCAGLVGGIQDNIKRPVSFLVQNVDINRNLILAAHSVGVKKLLNMGSSCMYPRNHNDALTESMVLQGELEPTNEGYAIAKIMAQRLCEYIMREDPSRMYKTMIPCNLYGRFDKFSPEHSHLVPAAIKKVHEAHSLGQKEVEIWGDGLARREFMYAGDLADCIARAIENFESVPSLMNVGLGVDYSVNEYYQAVAAAVGYRGGFAHNLTKPVGMKRKLVSTACAEKWGWKSRISLHAGLTETYKYYLQLTKI